MTEAPASARGDRLQSSAAWRSVGAVLCVVGGVVYFLGTIVNTHPPDVAGGALVPITSAGGGFHSLSLSIVPILVYWPGAVLLVAGGIYTLVRGSDRPFGVGMCLAAAIWATCCSVGLLLAEASFTLSFPFGNMEMSHPKPMAGIWMSVAGSVVAIAGAVVTVVSRVRAGPGGPPVVGQDPATSASWSRMRAGAVVLIAGGAAYGLGVCLYHHGTRYLSGSVVPGAFFLTFVSATRALTYLPGAVLLVAGGISVLFRRSSFVMVTGVCFAAGLWALCMSTSAFLYRWINIYGAIGPLVWRGWGWWGWELWSDHRIVGLVMASVGSVVGLVAAVSMRWALGSRWQPTASVEVALPSP